MLAHSQVDVSFEIVSGCSHDDIGYIGSKLACKEKIKFKCLHE